MRKLNITTIYVKRAYYFEPYGDLFRASERLLTMNGFKVLPTDGGYPPHQFDPLLQVDFNMDDARRQPLRGTNHIITSYLNEYKLPHDSWTKPWLTVTGGDDIVEPYTLIHLTPRWRTGSKVDWKKVLHSIEGKVYFTGFQYEWIEFCRLYGNVEWLPCNDILDVAILIRDAKAVYCNQSVSLALAQSMGKEYHCEFKPGKTNCMMNTLNEHKL